MSGEKKDQKKNFGAKIGFTTLTDAQVAAIHKAQSIADQLCALDGPHYDLSWLALKRYKEGGITQEALAQELDLPHIFTTTLKIAEVALQKFLLFNEDDLIIKAKQGNHRRQLNNVRPEKYRLSQVNLENWAQKSQEEKNAHTKGATKASVRSGEESGRYFPYSKPEIVELFLESCEKHGGMLGKVDFNKVAEEMEFIELKFTSLHYRQVYNKMERDRKRSMENP